MHVNVVACLFTGCRIPVVRLLWEQVDWVQFPAARLSEGDRVTLRSPLYATHVLVNEGGQKPRTEIRFCGARVLL